MSVDYNTDYEANSSGFSSVDSSLVEETQSKTSTIGARGNSESEKTDILDLIQKSIYEAKIAELESDLADCKKQLTFERVRYNRDLKGLEILFANQENQIKKLQNEYTKCQEKLREVLQQLGEIEFKILKKENEKKSAIYFKQIYSSQLSLQQVDECHKTTALPNITYTLQCRERNTSYTSECCASSEQTVDGPETLAPPAPDEEDETENIPSVVMSPRRASQNLPFGTAPHQQPQQYFGTAAGTINPPEDQYQTLLKALSNLMCFSADTTKLKNWASQNFSINVTSHEALDVFFDLDKEGVISASNLNQLRKFFETIVRFDLVHTIDQFQEGNYEIVEKYSVLQ